MWVLRWVLLGSLLSNGVRQIAGQNDAQNLDEGNADADTDQDNGVFLDPILQLADATILEVLVLAQSR